MARSPAKEKPAVETAARAPDRKKAVADAVARGLKKPVAEPKVEAGKPAAGRLFAVTRSRSLGWNPEKPLEDQADWEGHARFMNELESEGLVIAGGPLEGTPYEFLAVRAENEAAVRSRLAADPWEAARLLETTRIVGWDLKLGAGRL